MKPRNLKSNNPRQMPDLPPLVQALLNPNAYPEKPQTVEFVQTHISFVFLAGEMVFKVKKPVDFGFIDFTTLEKRRFYCQQELNLNRRLCPGVYLEVVPIIRSNGDFTIGGKGEIVEYAVKMRRLPQERTMDKLLRAGEVTSEMIVRVAEKLVDFHNRAEVISDGFGNLDTVRMNTEENFGQAEKYISKTISAETYQRIKEFNTLFMKANVALFDKRVQEGKVRDCHGDLHAAHICFDRDICIFDCIEFNERFRFCDVASEIAFLAMDLDYHGWVELSRDFVNAYVELSGDEELLQLLDFYKCYRAYVRGKVESFQLDDPHVSEEKKAEIAKTAGKYFHLAKSYTRQE